MAVPRLRTKLFEVCSNTGKWKRDNPWKSTRKQPENQKLQYMYIKQMAESNKLPRSTPPLSTKHIVEYARPSLLKDVAEIREILCYTQQCSSLSCSASTDFEAALEIFAKFVLIEPIVGLSSQLRIFHDSDRRLFCTMIGGKSLQLLYLQSQTRKSFAVFMQDSLFEIGMRNRNYRAQTSIL